MHTDSKKRRSSYLVVLLFAAGDAKRCHLDNSTLPQAAHVCYIYVVQDVSPLDCLHGHVKLTVVKVQTC